MSENNETTLAEASPLAVSQYQALADKIQKLVVDAEQYRQKLAATIVELEETMASAEPMLSFLSTGKQANVLAFNRQTDPPKPIEKICYFGWIAGAAKERQALEDLGITVGEDYSQDSCTFNGCIVPEAALARLEPLWLDKYVWGLTQEVRFPLGADLDSLSDIQLQAALAHWQGKVNGPENDGRLTAGSSADLDYFIDQAVAIKEVIASREESLEEAVAGPR